MIKFGKSKANGHLIKSVNQYPGRFVTLIKALIKPNHEHQILANLLKLLLDPLGSYGFGPFNGQHKHAIPYKGS